MIGTWVQLGEGVGDLVGEGDGFRLGDGERDGEAENVRLGADEDAGAGLNTTTWAPSGAVLTTMMPGLPGCPDGPRLPGAPRLGVGRWSTSLFSLLSPSRVTSTTNPITQTARPSPTGIQANGCFSNSSASRLRMLTRCPSFGSAAARWGGTPGAG